MISYIICVRHYVPYAKNSVLYSTLYTVYTVQYRAGYSTQHFINIFTVYKYKYDTVRYVQYHTVLYDT